MAGSGSWIGSKNTAWRDGHRRRPRSPRRSLRDREEIVGRNRALPAGRVVSGYFIRLGPRNDSIDWITINVGESEARVTSMAA
jgi:hypothetical protein